MSNAECTHMITMGRDGEKGSWCNQCGIKVLDVEPRECGGCTHHKQLIDGGICKKHLMACTASMHVTYKIATGTCWAPKEQ